MEPQVTQIAVDQCDKLARAELGTVSALTRGLLQGPHYELGNPPFTWWKEDEWVPDWP